MAVFSGVIRTGVVERGTCESPSMGQSRGRVFLAKEEETLNKAARWPQETSLRLGAKETMTRPV